MRVRTEEFDYENSPIEEQNILFGEIKNNYIDLIKEYGYSLEEYKEMVERFGVEFPRLFYYLLSFVKRKNNVVDILLF